MALVRYSQDPAIRIRILTPARHILSCQGVRPYSRNAHSYRVASFVDPKFWRFVAAARSLVASAVPVDPPLLALCWHAVRRLPTIAEQLVGSPNSGSLRVARSPAACLQPPAMHILKILPQKSLHILIGGYSYRWVLTVQVPTTNRPAASNVVTHARPRHDVHKRT